MFLSRQFIALTISLAVFFSNGVFAYAVETNHLAPLRSALPSIATAPLRPVTPSSLKQRPAVTLIQDVHMNLEAQTHIASMLQNLIDQNQVNLVAMEGAFQPLDFAPFRAISNKEVVKQVADEFLKADKLAAPSYVGITSAVNPPAFVGIDDKVHYDRNVQAYLDSRRIKASVVKNLNESENQLTDEKQGILTGDLLKYDQLRTAYLCKKIGLADYLDRMTQLAPADLTDLALEQFLEAYRMERALDFTRVEAERRVVIECLAARLNTSESSDLMAQSLAYKLGNVSFGAYYRSFKELCDRKNINLRQTPAFDNYIRYILLSDGIKADELFTAVSRLEKSIVQRLAQSTREKEVMKWSEYLQLAKKLIEFSLTAEEWEAYKTLGNTLHTELYTVPFPFRGRVRVGETPPLTPPLQRRGTVLLGKETVELRKGFFDLAPFERFYVEADIRSEKMVANLLPLKGPSALVVGGFHTHLITRLLRERGITYEVVTPKITKIDDEPGSAYLSVFAQQKSLLERLFDGDALFLKPPTEIDTVGSEMMQSVLERMLLEKKLDRRELIKTAILTAVQQPLIRDLMKDSLSEKPNIANLVPSVELVMNGTIRNKVISEFYKARHPISEGVGRAVLNLIKKNEDSIEGVREVLSMRVVSVHLEKLKNDLKGPLHEIARSAKSRAQEEIENQTPRWKAYVTLQRLSDEPNFIMDLESIMWDFVEDQVGKAISPHIGGIAHAITLDTLKMYHSLQAMSDETVKKLTDVDPANLVEFIEAFISDQIIKHELNDKIKRIERARRDMQLAYGVSNSGFAPFNRINDRLSLWYAELRDVSRRINAYTGSSSFLFLPAVLLGIQLDVNLNLMSVWSLTYYTSLYAPIIIGIGVALNVAKHNVPVHIKGIQSIRNYLYAGIISPALQELAFTAIPLMFFAPSLLFSRIIFVMLHITSPPIIEYKGRLIRISPFEDLLRKLPAPLLISILPFLFSLTGSLLGDFIVAHIVVNNVFMLINAILRLDGIRFQFGLGMFTESEILTVIQSLQSEDPQARLNASIQLSQWRNSPDAFPLLVPYVPILIDAFRYDDLWLCQNIETILRAMAVNEQTQDATVGQIIEAFSYTNQKIRESLSQIILNFAHDNPIPTALVTYLPVLFAALGDSSAATQRNIREALVAFGSDFPEEPDEAPNSSPEHVMLQQIEQMDELVDGLRDENPEVRLNVINQLMVFVQTPDQDRTGGILYSLEKIAKALQDEVPEVRRATIKLFEVLSRDNLTGMAIGSVMYYFVAALQDSDLTVRSTARKILKEGANPFPEMNQAHKITQYFLKAKSTEQFNSLRDKWVDRFVDRISSQNVGRSSFDHAIQFLQAFSGKSIRSLAKVLYADDIEPWLQKRLLEVLEDIDFETSQQIRIALNRDRTPLVPVTPPQAGAWLAEVVGKMVEKNPTSLVNELVERKPIRVSDIDQLLESRPSITLEQLNEWSDQDDFLSAFASKINEKKISLDTHQTEVVIAILIAAGLRSENVESLTKLITKRELVIVYDATTKDVELMAAFKASILFDRCATVVIPDGLRAKYGEMFNRIKPELLTDSNWVKPRIIDESEIGRELFDRNGDMWLLKADDLQIELKASIKDMAVVHSDSIRIVSADKNLFLIRFSEFVGLSRFAVRTILSVARKAMQAA